MLHVNLKRTNVRPTVCALAAALLLAASHAGANVITGPVVNPANGHSYYLLEQDTWTNSEAFAQTLGGHLVTINDAAENDWVFDTFADFGGADRALWIGFNDVKIEGSFVWSSGEPATFTNWSAGEPNNFGGDEHFAQLFPPSFGALAGLWNDQDDDPVADGSPPAFGVVEVIPEPASLALLGLGGLTLLRRNTERKEKNR